MPAAREVAVGVVRRPFGLNGDVFVHPDPDLDEDFAVGRRYRAGGADRFLQVAATAVHRGLRVVRFADVDDRDAALALRDVVLYRPAEARDVGDGAFWADDLVGMQVVDERGRALGTLAAVTDGTAHDYLVVRDPAGRDVLVPAVEELVTVRPRRIVLRPPAGLFDPAEGEEA